MGDDLRIKVDCGDQPMAECIDPLRPYLDRLIDNASSSSDDSGTAEPGAASN